MAEEPRSRIRWEWFFACILLGVAALVAGFVIAPGADRPGYFGGVLANIGTTLLLVGVVLLLERRIVATAVRAVRRGDDALREQIRQLEERMAAEWAGATAENLSEKRAASAKLTEEFTERVVKDAEG